MKYSNYTIINELSIADLVQRTNEYLNAGYAPLGGPAWDGSTLKQVVVMITHNTLLSSATLENAVEDIIRQLENGDTIEASRLLKNLRDYVKGK